MATFHLTNSMRGQREMSKIQKNNCHYGHCVPSFTGETSSVPFDLTHAHRFYCSVFFFKIFGRGATTFQGGEKVVFRGHTL